MDSYVVIGTVLAVMASAVLLLRQPRPADQKMKSDMLKIGEQMKMYKQTAAMAQQNASTKPKDASNAAQFPGGRLTILFGSQTGTAEGFADMLKKEGRKHGFDAHAVDLEEYDALESLPNEKCVIFVMATYGEGDPTDNAVAFHKLLKNKDAELSDDAFKGVGYTVFGLGNRQYEHYNAMGRFVDEHMASFGAHRVYHYGEGDDDGSMDEDFDNWKENLWRELRQQFVAGVSNNDGDDANAKNSDLAPIELEYNVREVRCPPGGVTPPVSSETRMKTSTKHFFTAANAKVIVNRELRQSTDGGSTVHIEMDLKDTGVKYVTADNLAVLPDNPTDIVEQLANLMGYDLEQWVTLEPVGEDTHGELPFPTPCTIETILTSYLAINSAPRKGPLKQMAYYARDESERARLLHLSSKEGKDDYQQWVLDDERSFVDVFAHFTSVRVPLGALIELVPYQQPRYYTISSSSLVNPQRVHITVSIISNKKSDGRVFRGVCTNHLAGLSPLGDHSSKKKKRDSRPGEQGVKKPREWPSARVFVRPSTFRLPKDPQTPVILIGPGTGIAPMRAFLHERDQMQKNGVTLGRCIMYFGCRRRDEDYIYRDELERFQSNGVLTDLHLAFSREQAQKVYVQHLLEQQGADVWNLINEHNAHIYVCGATSMGNDVHKVLTQILEKHGNKTEAEAAALITKMQDKHRYIQELWA
ncbi:hypothetical protein ATCC90586_002659 [Pythium insidiosum]|nr:hypothetical protein ATCC90586_002659 [Pythium insidiosum]